MHIENVQATKLPKCLVLSHGQYFYITRVDRKQVWLPFGHIESDAIKNAGDMNLLRRKEKAEIFGRIRRANETLRDFVLHRDGYKCAYCGSPDDLVIDHVIPFVSGGSTHRNNLVTACNSCNMSKGDRNVLEFICSLQGAASKIITSVLKNAA
jgi:hypothetical protein